MGSLVCNESSETLRFYVWKIYFEWDETENRKNPLNEFVIVENSYDY